MVTSMFCRLGVSVDDSGARKRVDSVHVAVRLVALSVIVCLLSACSDRSARVVHVILPDASNIREGAVVHYRGIEVGHVTAVRIVDTGVQLDIDIQRADAPIRRADLVRIAPTGIFGDRGVEIVPGPVSAPKLASNGWLAVFPPDTLAPLREELIGAVVKNAFEQLGSRDSASSVRKAAVSIHPPAPRSRP